MMPAQKRKVCEHFMKRTKKELCLKLEVPPDTAEKCILAAMAPMSAMATGRRSILLTSRQMSTAAVLCEDYARSDENAEAILQTIPSELLARLRKRGLCLRQLARHLVKGDTVYEV